MPAAMRPRDDEHGGPGAILNYPGLKGRGFGERAHASAFRPDILATKHGHGRSLPWIDDNGRLARGLSKTVVEQARFRTRGLELIHQMLPASA